MEAGMQNGKELRKLPGEEPRQVTLSREHNANVRALAELAEAETAVLGNDQQAVNTRQYVDTRHNINSPPTDR